MQHARLSCIYLSPGVCWNSCPWVSDAIQSSHPMSPPSPLALNLSQHLGLFQWVGSWYQSIGASASVSVLPMNIQDWFPLGLAGLISFLSKGLSRVFFNTTVWKHQFFGAQPSLMSLFLIHCPGFAWLFSRSVVSDSATPWTAAHQASLSHVCWVNDAIPPSHPLSFSSPPALSLFQHQGLFQWVSSSHQVASVLEFQLLHQSFQWTFSIDFP